MLSSLVFITLMPLQVSPSGAAMLPLNKPLAVAAFVDSAQILGLPKFRLRDSSGNLYFANRSQLQEPAALLYRDSGMLFISHQTKRKAFISTYVRR
ncbi:hypothetical protein [Polynucleobacter sp. AM-7D1]|uniref:hypothetical protein n=1 Tax=Polynucleobacter sp. AM-7D1 TaxID=2689102 RepID=UPI001BFE8B34|nr:hypothetical protein [Polynucleobacter sp. AM-7D1]QWE27934.1 hypothetical protein GQ359_05800 [Polynucleobacter sp. AM-7D1]